MTRRRGKRIPVCSDCGAGVTWLTSRGNRVPFERLPVDPGSSSIAMPCYRGEAWPVDDLVLELEAARDWTAARARRYVREQVPWHVPHLCPPQEASQ